MVNINIAVPEELHQKLKLESALSNRTQKELLISMLSDYVRKHGKH